MRLNRHETLSRFIHEGMKSLDVGVRIKKKFPYRESERVVCMVTEIDEFEGVFKSEDIV